MRGPVLLALVLPAVTGATLRRATLAAAAAGAAADVETQKVEHLLLDIDTSVRKAGSDAEFVYATLYTYDQQLEASLTQEVEMVSKELAKLRSLQAQYIEQAGSPAAKRQGSGAPASPAASSRAGAVEDKELVSLVQSVQTLIAFLERGTAEQSKGLHTAGHQQAWRSLRHLLAQHQALRPQFPDVFAAFLPPMVLVQQGSTTAAGKRLRAPLRVRLTRALKLHTVAALEAIQGRLREKQAQALVQLGSRQQKVSSRGAENEASDRAQEGIQAEEQQKVEELAFSATFTEAVLRIDQEFQTKVKVSMKKKAELVEAIRNARQSQHRTLVSLIDLLQGKFTVDSQPGAAPGAPATSPSFLQLRDAVANPDSTAARQRPLPMSSLQEEIETALKKKEDTHGILMRVKEMLDRTAPIDAESVQSVVAEFGGVLRIVNGEQTREDEAKRRCEAEVLESGEQEQGLKASLSLMEAVHNHTKAAIEAAKYNLQGIMAKTKALEMSTQEFSKIVTKTTNTLQDQSRDRHTIMAAVEKAREIVSGRPGSGPAASALLGQMLGELRAQERGEGMYRATEVAFRSAFLSYARSYLQLLRERRGHYESSLSALELYADEVESDAAAQADSLRSGEELGKEGSDLCKGILRSYDARSQRRQELSKVLRTVLPDMAGFLGAPGPVMSESQ